MGRSTGRMTRRQLRNSNVDLPMSRRKASFPVGRDIAKGGKTNEANLPVAGVPERGAPRPGPLGSGGGVMLEVAFQALATVLTFEHLLFLSGGVFLGLVIGFLPGLGGTAGLALVLPFVFGMEPSLALAMMIGLQSVTSTSDTFPAVLMGIPGTAGSQATVMDGHPMAQQGQAARALSAAFISSMFGGVFGAFILSGAIIVAVPIILSIGFGEQMMLVLLALSLVGMLTGDNIWKGLAACGIGLMLGTIGSTPSTGIDRYTFGSIYLIDGIPLVILGLAMFATPEIVELLKRQGAISKGDLMGTGRLQGLKDWFNNKWLSIRCAAIGCIVGALPGLGGAVVDWIAYGHALQTTRNRETYGKGDVRGVIAPESANNAKEGGALIPTLLFGIPGSGSMAILLGGFVLIGLEPGPVMVRDHLDLVYVMIWSVALANIVGAGTCFLFAPQIAKLTRINYAILAPFMIGLIFFASFQATRDWGDLFALLLLSLLGLYMKRFGWPRPALLIGFVLSGQVESLVYQTYTVYGLSFLQRPIVLVLLALTVLSVVAILLTKKSKAALDEDGPNSRTGIMPQMIFFGGVVAFTLWIVLGSQQLDFYTGLFPLIASCATLVTLAPLAIGTLRARSASTVFHDEDRAIPLGSLARNSTTRYVVWMLAMLGLIGVVGFVAGMAGFVAAFLLVEARLRPGSAALGAVAIAIAFGLLSHFLSLAYPEGALQVLLDVRLPWPFG